MPIGENKGKNESQVAGIEKILSVLESGENFSERENYGALVRNHQNYLVLFVKNERGTERAFKLPGLQSIESMPVFLTEEVFSLFRNGYLKKHGFLETFANARETLTLKSLSGRELFEIIPQTALGSVFVISPNGAELFFNFNLAEVFTDCFRESARQANPVFPELAEEPEVDENDGSIGAASQSAPGKIERSRKLRALLEVPEWTVLISQPTKNKLLKGEFSRDDFAMDQLGDGRVFVFSDAAALENYKAATGREKLYSIKVDRQTIFGADLSAYNLLIVDAFSPNVALIGEKEFRRLNELFAALEIERKLSRIDAARTAPGHYFEVAEFYLDVKNFRKFILPVDARTNEPLSLDDRQRVALPVFTAEDCFEGFRRARLETFEAEKQNFIETRFIDGESLFRELIGKKGEKIIFNPDGPVSSIDFDAALALKIYCA